jgi:predicted TPR repeat methyltransferase
LIVNLGHRILSNDLVYDIFQTCVGSYRFRKRFLSNLDLTLESRVIELGCGTGITLETMRNNHYIGIDISQKYLQKAHNRNTSARLILGDVSSSQTFEDISATKKDLVLALALWHHIDDDQMIKTLQNISGISQVGTKVYSLDPFVDELTSSSASWVARNDRGKFLRSVKHLEELANFAGFHLESKVSRRELYIPTNVIKCTLTKI